MERCRVEEQEAPSANGMQPIRLGSLKKEAVVQMAALTGDFDPRKLVQEVAAEEGDKGLVMHPTWISGLTDAAVRVWFREVAITYLSIDHLSEVVHTDALSVTLTSREQGETREEVRIRLSVENQEGKTVAKGEVCIVVQRCGLTNSRAVQSS